MLACQTPTVGDASADVDDPGQQGTSGRATRATRASAAAAAPDTGMIFVLMTSHSMLHITFAHAPMELSILLCLSRATYMYSGCYIACAAFHNTGGSETLLSMSALQCLCICSPFQ